MAMLTSMATTQERVTAAVRAYMKDRRLNQTDVARLIGVTQTSVSRRLRGEGRWTLDEIDLLILAGVEIPALEHKEMEHEMKTITTIEQLEALPDRAAIKAADETLLLCIGSGQLDWDGNVWQDEESRWIGSHDIDLPATLLHPLIFTAEDVEKAAAMINWESLGGPNRHPAEVEWQLLTEGERDIYRKLARAALTNIGEVEA